MISLLGTDLSVNFEIKDTLEIGRKLLMTSLTREGFFRNGVTSALFIVVDTILVDIDELTMFVNVGRRQVKYSFSSQVGTGSSEHDVDGLLLITRLTSSSIAGTETITLSSIASGLFLGLALSVSFHWIIRL